MTVFLIIAGLMVAGALLMLVPPVLKGARREAEQEQASAALVVLREQLAELEAERAAGRLDAETYANSRDELERRALEEGQAADAAISASKAGPAKGWAAGLAVVVPVLAVAGYLAFGEPEALDPAKRVDDAGAGFTRAQVEQMVGSLVARLENEPDNVEGWSILARTYTMLQDYPKAAAAYEHLAGLLPDNADVITEWADVTAASEGSVLGKAAPLVERALAIDPGHPKALAIAGTVAYQRGDYAGAAAHWEKILARIPPGAEMAGGVIESINEARQKAGMAPLAPPEPAAAAPGPIKLSGRLEIAPALRDRLAADDTVFVFARSAQGGPPVAALRFRGGDLPLSFSFEQATLMGGAIPPTVTLGARVAKGGTATAGAGDLEGALENVAIDASGVSLVIDRVRD